MSATSVLSSNHVARYACESGWRLLLLLVPITSPLFLGAESGSIRPPAGLVALLMLPLVLTTDWRRLLQDPAIRRLGLFCLWAAIIGAAVILFNPPAPLPAKGATAMGLFAKALASLASGVAVYLVARNRLQNHNDVLVALPWLLTGLGLSVLLALIQNLSYGPLSDIREPVVTISRWFSSAWNQPIPHMGRSNGLAYEPSYLASQLYLLAIPLGWGAWASGHRRIGGIALALGVAGCILVGSRLGMMAAGATMLTGFVLLGRKRSWRSATMAMILALVATIPASLIIRENTYVTTSLSTHQDISEPSPQGQDQDPFVHTTIFRLIYAANVGPRASAIAATLPLMAEHPFVGTGLGMSPLMMPAHLPAWGNFWEEVQNGRNPTKPELMNPMAMLARIPTELGLIGVLLGVWFLIAHRNRSSWGSAVLVTTAAVALLADSTILASFALPAPWILLAMLRVPASTTPSAL